MPQLDVFTGDAFSMHSLTSAYNKQAYQPMRLGALKLFQEAGVRTTYVDVESRDGRLSLIQTSERGGPSGPRPSCSRSRRSSPSAWPNCGRRTR